jgi:hypothetical protein
MSPERIAMLVPGLIGVLSVAASVGYIFAADWRRALYWAAAAAITVAVTA